MPRFVVLAVPPTHATLDSLDDLARCRPWTDSGIESGA